MSEQFGADAARDIEDALDECIREAIEKGLTEKGAARLQVILKKHMNVFGIKLRTSPPANLGPFEVELSQMLDR